MQQEKIWELYATSTDPSKVSVQKGLGWEFFKTLTASSSNMSAFKLQNNTTYYNQHMVRHTLLSTFIYIHSNEL